MQNRNSLEHRVHNSQARNKHNMTKFKENFEDLSESSIQCQENQENSIAAMACMRHAEE